MVCKEQLCDWFRSLSPYKRIDYMCALMQLLVPLELRFLGSVLEDLCKKDFLYLRDAETKANNITHLEHITNLSEILISLSLLHSTRSRCSYALFNVIHAYLQRCFNKILATEPDKFPDLMTMLTLTVNHPAFSYEQKQSIYEFYSRACDYSKDKKLDKEGITLDLPDINTIGKHTQLHMAQKAFITGLEVKENSKRHHDNRLEIKVTWSDNRVEYVYKTTKELSEFHNKLCELFPSTGDDNTKIPVLKTRDEKHAISMYIRKLGKLPKHILGSDHVVEFFKGDNSPKSSYCASTSPSNLSIEDDEAILPHFPMKTLTYVNSQNIGHDFTRLQDVTIPHRQLAGQISSTRRLDSPSQSPHSSSTESPQNSPVASPSSQQSELMQLLVSEYPDILNKYGFDQILSMKDDELVKADLSKEALKKLRVKINEHLNCEKTNGMIETGIPIQNILAMYTRFPPPPPPQITHPPPPFCHFNPPIRPPTRDSSPCNSEPSSPPASPHLQQHSNLVRPPVSQAPEEKATREEKDFAQAASIPRTGGGKVSQGSVKYPPHSNKPPEGLLPQFPLTHDLQGLSNQNGFQSDNPQGIVRPDNRGYQQFAGKYAVYPPKLWMMQTEKAPQYAYAPIPTTVFSNMMDNQARPYMNQPGILGQPPNAVSSRPGFTSVSNSTTMTCPRTSLTPTPPMPGNPGTKSPNTVSTIVNSSSDPNLQSNEPSNSPSPLQMNAPPPVPCSVGPAAHNNQPCSACGLRPQPGWPIQGLNGYIHHIPSMHHFPPHINQQTFANGTHSELVFGPMSQPMFYTASTFMNMTYGNNMYQNVPGNGAPKKIFCCNCGDSNHKASDCKERTMENIDGHFKLQFKTKSDSD